MSGSVVYSQEELEAKVAEARDQVSQELLGGIRQSLDGGDSVLQVLRPLYPEELIVYSGGKYNFVPINRSLKQSTLEEAGLNVLESGEYQYVRDGQVISHKGIDVSKHQGTIDWNLVAQDGVEFAFIRVGYRGYGTGKLMEDEFFEENIKGALSAGIKTGVYFYSQAVTEEELLEEAAFVLEKIAPYKIECPVVFDVERVSGAEGRMDALSVEERTSLALLFCQTIEQAGYKPMIYHNTEMGVMLLRLEVLEAYGKWFAAYSDKFYYPYEYKIWQYSQSGTVQGIQGNVDLNISFGPVWEE
jgi:GH25 family lysozyme M1 (1,4-beta-N-acetylmuramidase)